MKPLRTPWYFYFVVPVLTAVVGSLAQFVWPKDVLITEICMFVGILLTGFEASLILAIEYNSASRTSDLAAEMVRASRLFDLYHSVEDPRLLRVRDLVFSRATRDLEQLARGEARLEGNDYYVWLDEMLAQVPNGTSCLAVSTMDESTWELTPERNFLNQQAAATARGVKVSRIFLTTAERLRGSSNVLATQSGARVDVLVALEADVTDRVLLREVGSGFIVFGDDAVLVDDGLPPETVSGTVFVARDKIREYQALFRSLSVCAQPRVAPARHARRPTGAAQLPPETPADSQT